MLELDSTEAVELVLVAISDKTKGVEEAKRSLGSKLGLEGLDGGARRLLAGRGEGCGGGTKGGGDGELHFADLDWEIVSIVVMRASSSIFRDSRRGPTEKAFARIALPFLVQRFKSSKESCIRQQKREHEPLVRLNVLIRSVADVASSRTFLLFDQ